MKPHSLFLSFALFLGMLSRPALRADDLDVTGNVITFGELTGNSSLAGATLQFQDLINADSSYTANLYSILAREQAQWQWLRAADSSGETTLPVMILDTQARLNLYDPATAGASPAVPTIILAPGVQGGVQTSKLPRLELSNQTLDTDNSVITKILGDARYLLAPGTNQGLELTSGINVNTGGTGSSNTVPANAAAIGQNLQVSSGQVVVGRNNTAANTEVFVVGSGANSTQTMNALSISNTGDTTIGGNLTVAGEASLTDATVSGTLTVNNEPVATQSDVDQTILTERTASNEAYYRVDQPLTVSQETTFNGSVTASQNSVFQKSLVVEGQRDPVEVVTNPATTKIIPMSGQVILIPEQGDISMGEFRSGPLPVANP